DGDLRQFRARAEDSLRSHGGRRAVDQDGFVVRLDGRADLGFEKVLRLLARELETADDDRGMNVLLEKILGALEELTGDHDRRGRSVAALLVLGLGDLDQHLRGRVLDVDFLQDRDAVVGDRDVPHSVDEHLVHAARTEGRSHHVGDGSGRSDVVRCRALSALAFRTFFQDENRGSLKHTVTVFGRIALLYKRSWAAKVCESILSKGSAQEGSPATYRSDRTPGRASKTSKVRPTTSSAMAPPCATTLTPMSRPANRRARIRGTARAPITAPPASPAARYP